MPIHPKTTDIRAFKGLNNVLRPERTPKEYLKEAENVDIDKTGGTQKREGYEKVLSGSWHSIWSDGPYCFGVKDNDLVSIKSDYSITTLLSGVSQNPISFFRMEDSVYFSSEYINGVIENNSVRPWGIIRPSPKPTLSLVPGALNEGVYQVALTYTTVDGRESGARVSDQLFVPKGSCLLVENIPPSTDSTVTHINIYMSHNNGDTLYYKTTITNGISSYKIADDTGLRRPLDTFNRVEAPKGHLVAETHGRSWIAENNYLWFSDPYAYELFDLTDGYFYFPEKIRAIMPVEDGLWVASDGLYYLNGANPIQMKQDLKEPIKIVPGSEVKIPGAYIFIDNTPIGYKWLVHSDKGIYVCFNQGVTLNMTSQNYEFPEAVSGASEFIQRDGINKYLSVLKHPKKDSENATVGDQVTATIIRNGVVVSGENNGAC